MKKIITIGLLLISTLTFAQSKKDTSKAGAKIAKTSKVDKKQTTTATPAATTPKKERSRIGGK